MLRNNIQHKSGNWSLKEPALGQLINTLLCFHQLDQLSLSSTCQFFRTAPLFAEFWLATFSEVKIVGSNLIYLFFQILGVGVVGKGAYLKKYFN